MSEDNQVLKTTVQDLNTIKALINGNSVTSMRQGVTILSSRILTLQQMLSDIEATENSIKGYIYDSLKDSELEVRKDAQNTKVNPTQAYSRAFQSSTVNPGYSSTVYQATVAQYGVKERGAALNKIAYDKKSVVAQIRAYQSQLSLVEAAIALEEGKKTKQQKLVEEATGKSLSPSTDDFELDRIQKSVYANVSLLFELAKAYTKYSVNAENKRAYTDDAVIPTKLLVMRQVFSATVEQFPKYMGQGTSLQGIPYTPLDRTDPGATLNLSILKKDLDSIRSIGRNNNKADKKAAEYVKDLESIANDGTVSAGIERKIDPPLPAENSMVAQTATFSKTAEKLGVAYVGTYAFSTLGSVIKNAFKNKNQKLFPNLPICANVVIPPEAAPTDVKIAARDLVREGQIAEGGKRYFDAVNAASVNQEIGNIPNSAPNWVTQWAGIFGQGPSGSMIVRNGDLVDGYYLIVYAYGPSPEAATKKAYEIAKKDENAPLDGGYSYERGGKIFFYGAWLDSPF